LLLLIGIIIKFIWWILGAVAMVVLFFIAWSAVRWYDERRATEARYRDALAARADQQHNWVMQGDEPDLRHGRCQTHALPISGRAIRLIATIARWVYRPFHGAMS
jgi:hypothetical protein